MSQDVKTTYGYSEGPQCEAQDSKTKRQCISTNTRRYFIPGKPLSLQKRWFCQEHGVMMVPSGGGGTEMITPKDQAGRVIGPDIPGKTYPPVTWDDSEEIIEKVPLQAEIKRRPRAKPEA